jgi:hypothetical protein
MRNEGRGRESLHFRLVFVRHSSFIIPKSAALSLLVVKANGVGAKGRRKFRASRKVLVLVGAQ